ncbi:hypothetical protein AX15_000904 [Amanita polypyramis BW_CC]|nr:hypothetical protein AX15_000904 [Amanita polypyramis BW_CC]
MILINPNEQTCCITEHLRLSNHHQLLLAGIAAACQIIQCTRGPTNLLVRNQAALHTIFTEKHGPNAHYTQKANITLQSWFTNQSNFLHLGWLPSDYQPPAISMHTKQMNKVH